MAFWRKGIEHDLQVHRPQPTDRFLATALAQVRASRGGSRPNLRVARGVAGVVVLGALLVVALVGGGASGFKNALQGHSPFAAAEVDYIAPHLSVSVVGQTTVSGINYVTSNSITYTGACDSNAVDSPTEVTFSGSGSTGVLAQTCTGGSYTTNTITLPDGTYTINAFQQPFNLTASETFTVDTVGPHPTITAPASGVNGINRTTTFTGTAGTAPGDSGTVTLTLVDTTTNTTVFSGQVVTVSGGQWSYSPACLARGDFFTLTVSQTDGAGNTGTATSNFSTTSASHC